MSRLLPQRPAPRIGIQVILAAALLAYCAWIEGARKFLREGLPFGIICGAITIGDRVLPSYYGTLAGSFHFLLIVLSAGLLYGVCFKLLSAGADAGASGGSEEQGRSR